MGCYWGCGTKGNRVAWTILTNLFIIAIGLITAGVVGNFTGKGSKNCLKVYTDCVGKNTTTYDGEFWGIKNVTITAQLNNKECFKLADQQCNLKIWGALFLSGAGLLVLCMCVTFFFCCCASRPRPCDYMADAPMTKGDVVTWQAPAPQGAMYYPANIPATPVHDGYGPGRV